MNKKLLVFLFGITFAFHSSGLFSQGLMAVANKQFELEAYDLAIDNYKKVLTKEEGNAEAMFNLAESYRLSNNYQESLTWYDQLTTLEKFNPVAYLNYGHILKSMGKLDEAKYWYYKYMEFKPDVAKNYAESCEKAKELLAEEDFYEVKLFPGNTANSDFGIAKIGDQMVYSSFRTDMKRDIDAKNKSLIRVKGNQLFEATYNSNPNEVGVELLRGDLKSSYHMGPVAYAGTENSLVAYTKNNFKDGVKFVRSNDTNMSLFFADKEQTGDFSKERPFPYNETGFSTGFANFSNNGEVLYFASNRPGGYGGYDIYVSYLRNGSWSIPVNLGNKVNSSGNEITPYFLADENQLFFASDFHPGIGGFDMFMSEKTGDIEYSTAMNMGKGVNSPSDDYYPMMDQSTGNYYFTSNRLGGMGNDDIYYATPKAGLEMLAIAEDMPAAVDLNDLAIENESQNTENVALASEPFGGAFIADNNFSMADARLLARRDVILAAPPSKVYFIQVAALSRTKGNVGIFTRLTNLGNLYKVYKSNSTKIRLGYYYDKNEAAKVLSSVKSLGYNDAFIVHEALMTSELELVGDSKSNNSKGSIKSNFTPAPAVSNYKVRLASYTDPLWFDISRVNDLGEIEQWTKGQYTIFILSGYGSLDNAQRAMVKAKNRGFTEAHLVVDNNGYLEKLKQN